MLFDGFLEKRFKDLFGGKIVHMSFDCPKNLREVFVSLAKEKFGSACKALQFLMAVFVLKTTLERHAFGDVLSRVANPPIHIGEVKFLQYVQSRPRRLVHSAVVSGDCGGRFYCALKNEHLDFSALPSGDCFSCPNRRCSEFTASLANEVLSKFAGSHPAALYKEYGKR
jgi:hypothetical protein